MKNKIITFGELLLRFSKDQHNRLQQGRAFFGDYGGSEANVAVSLATLGDDVEYVTRVPDSPIGRASCMKLREFNVGTQHVLYGGDRMGSYYYEGSAGMRSSKVIYDRAYSSFYYLEPGMINWRKIFADAAVFHASGIAGAVSKESADATFEALRTARWDSRFRSTSITARTCGNTGLNRRRR